MKAFVVRSLGLAVCLFLFSAELGVYAAETEPPTRSPRYFAPKPPQKVLPGQFPTGYRPDPFYSPELAEILPGPKSATVSLDWRTSGDVTVVKNQGSYGTCWIFTGLGGFESTVERQDSPSPDPDCSEWDIVEGLAEGNVESTGGHTKEVCNHITKYGTIKEADNGYGIYPAWPSPQPIASYWSPPPGTPQRHALEWHRLGNYTSSSASVVDALQTIIETVGPVATAFHIDPVNTWATGLNGPGVAFNTYSWDSDWVIPPVTGTTTDHAVLIVGWDDNKAHYYGGGSGAWLVKNSWGTGWGNGGNGSTDAGYFWIAYGSANIGTDCTIYPLDGYKSYDSTEERMCYDEFGCWTAAGWTSQYTVYMCVRYTPTFTGSKSLTAVDVWIPQPDVSYEVKIFDTWNGTSSMPTTQLGSTETGSVTYEGYYSIPLSTPAPLTSADEICVHVKLTDNSSSDTGLVPYEGTSGYYPSWFVNTPTMETNKSYARYSPSFSWGTVDSGGWAYGDIGVRIRYGATAAPDPEADFSSVSYSVGEGGGSKTITVDLDVAPPVSCSVQYATSNGSATSGEDYTTASGTLTFNSPSVQETFNVPIIDDGTFDEGSETVTLTLSAPSGCTLAGTNNPATLTITDNDTSGSLSTVYVDFDHTGDLQGTISAPYNTFAQGVAAVSTSGTIKIDGTATDYESAWTGTINTAMTLESDPAGTIRIGVIGGGSKATELIDPDAEGMDKDALADLLLALQTHLAAALNSKANAGKTSDADGESTLTADGKVYEPVLPFSLAGEALRAARPDSVLAIRLRSEGEIDPDTLWAPGPVDGAAVEWMPVQDGDSRDVWVLFRPQETWYLDDVITLTAGAEDAAGESVGPKTYAFQVAEDDQGSDAIWQPKYGEDFVADGLDLTAESNDTAVVAPAGDEAGEALAEAIQEPFKIGPERVYDVPQRVWLPVPPGVDAGAVGIYYYHATGPDRGWYPAQDVEGWLVADSRLTLDIDGTAYLGFLVRHAGIVQLGIPTE